MKLIKVEDSDLTGIENNRHRLFSAIEKPLSAETILQDINNNNRQRVIVICNRVSLAQNLFRDLQALDESLEITLLHSRFLPEDRAKKEAQLKENFAQNWRETNDGICWILIATQVIEVGLNITCEVMHSQLSPVNSLLQRAGRCARFAGETGHVFVYRSVEVNGETSPTEETARKTNFLPYKSDICEQTWQVLLAHTNSDKAQQNVGFRLEEAWVNAVHTAETLLEKERRHNNRTEFENQFNNAFFKGDQATASELIRDVDSRRVYVWQDTGLFLGEDEEINPDELTAFSVPVSLLLRVWDECIEEYKTDWIFKCIEQPKNKAAERYSLPVCIPLKTKSALITSVRVLVNPRFVSYDDEVGLMMGVDVVGDGFVSPKKPPQNRANEFSYRMDNYVGHLVLMWKFWRENWETVRVKNGVEERIIYAAMREELLTAGGRFIQRKIFPGVGAGEAEALFEILVFFAILTHDLGKLQTRWQEVMRGWQSIAHAQFSGKNPGNYLLAHTDFDAGDSQQKNALKSYESQHKRPNHAVESAFLAQGILKQSLMPLLCDFFGAEREQCMGICYAVIMAAGRHHSAWTAGWKMENVAKIKALVLHSDAQKNFISSWRCLVRFLPPFLPLQQANLDKNSYQVTQLDFNQFTPDQIAYQQLYALVVRALRLCDGRSVH